MNIFYYAPFITRFLQDLISNDLTFIHPYTNHPMTPRHQRPTSISPANRRPWWRRRDGRRKQQEHRTVDLRHRCCFASTLPYGRWSLRLYPPLPPSHTHTHTHTHTTPNRLATWERNTNERRRRRLLASLLLLLTNLIVSIPPQPKPPACCLSSFSTFGLVSQ